METAGKKKTVARTAVKDMQEMRMKDTEERGRVRCGTKRKGRRREKDGELTNKRLSESVYRSGGYRCPRWALMSLGSSLFEELIQFHKATKYFPLRYRVE